MNFALRIASRYLFSQRKQTFISIISIMSILGVAIGVAALIIAMSVYAGFSSDIREKILGANAHIMLLSHDISKFDNLTPVLNKVKEVDKIKSATPFLYTEVMLSSNNGVKGLVLRGIDPYASDEPISILENLVDGSVTDLVREEGKAQGIIIGEGLAKSLYLTVGSRVNLLSPSGQASAAGFTPKLIPFRVAGIFKAGMFEYDSALAFVSLEAGQDLLGIPRGRISGIEIMVDEPYLAPEVAKVLDSKFLPPFYTRDWTQTNQNLFAALELEKIGMYLVLAMVVLVGSFSIVTSLVMLVMEKTKDIAIMISMGARAKTIRNIFMLQGTIIGLIGTSLGCFLGLFIAFLLKKYKFIELPKGVYPSDTLPILVLPSDVFIIICSAMLLCFLATIYPARQASRLEPAQALRYE